MLIGCPPVTTFLFQVKLYHNVECVAAFDNPPQLEHQFCFAEPVQFGDGNYGIEEALVITLQCEHYTDTEHTVSKP